MFFTGMMISECCDKSLHRMPQITKDKKLDSTARSFVGLTAGDAFLFITTLVIGILGILGIIPGMPPAAAYSLIAISGAVLLSWVALIAITKGEVLSMVKKVLVASVSPDPKL